MNVNKEAERIKALKRYDILDSPQDGSMNRLTALAAKVFNMPIVIISLVDTDRIWFKSRYGLEGVEQVGRDPGLCDSAIFSEDVYIVENAIENPSALTNPLVSSEFGLRFYAAAPLRTHDGHNLGTFCLIDQKQRYLTDGQKAILQDFAAIAMDEIELRLASRLVVKKANLLLEDAQNQLQACSAALEKVNVNGSDTTVEPILEASQVSLQNIQEHLAQPVI